MHRLDMDNQYSFVSFSDLDHRQKQQYRNIIQNAFPRIVLESKVTEEYWPRLETYFPEYQVYLTNSTKEIVAFINAIPFSYKRPLNELPDDGWDWMLKQGIENKEQNIIPNCIGGLQIIVNTNYLGQGYSRIIINAAKSLRTEKGLEHLLIPIRPTFKHHFPHMEMEKYMHYQEEGKLYDPWIRSHLRNDARIIKVCHNAMNIKRAIPYWEGLLGRKIKTSGNYVVDGALNTVTMNLEDNLGEYREANIWISYD